MEQIPKYLIVGAGRVATHFSHYFDFLSVVYQKWSRGQSNFKDLVESSDVILLAISDSQIIDFINKNPILKTKKIVHFSGSLYLENILGIHPLMSFNTTLYDFHQYKEIAFIIDGDIDYYRKIFPQLENKFYQINGNDKAYYHALCVMSGNFTVILWTKIIDEFKTKFNIAEDAIFPYLKKIMENIMLDYQSALTGPLIRNDRVTIKRNLESLHDDDFEPIYKSFLQYWDNKNGYKPHN